MTKRNDAAFRPSASSTAAATATNTTADIIADKQQVMRSPSSASAPWSPRHLPGSTIMSPRALGLVANDKDAASSSSNNKPKAAASLLKQIATKNLKQAVRADRQRNSPRAQPTKDDSVEPEQHDADDASQELTHDGNNASIVLDELSAIETPWTPKSLGRAKTAIIYKQTLNDTLLVLERNIFFFSDWVPYFVSLQDDYILMFKNRERWEQGLKPDKIIELHHMLLLGDMKVDVDASDTSHYDSSGTSRLFRRKLLETDELDEWLNEELRQHLVVGAGSRVGSVLSTNPNASARCVVEFASYNQSTFELWTKSIRRVLQAKREQHSYDFHNDDHDAAVPSIVHGHSVHHRRGSSGHDDDAQSDRQQQQQQRRNSNLASSSSSSTGVRQKTWVSPGQDSRLTLHQSEIWCNRVLSGEKEKAESEIRRIVAMEKLVAQVTSPRMALLVYEKVSRVHELFVANSRREIEAQESGNAGNTSSAAVAATTSHHTDSDSSSSTRVARIAADVLHFFADHLKRKYSVFLILALAYGVGEEQIRDAHESMCLENAAAFAGVGGGSGELERPATSYGFEDAESVELYEKYRDAAVNYYKMNYGDAAAAEEEDAIMHLPVMLQVALVRHDDDETAAMLAIMQTVKTRLAAHCGEQENDA